MIKILKTIPVADGIALWKEQQQQLAEPLLHPGLSVEWWEVPDIETSEIKHNFDTDLVAIEHVRLVLRAEQEGFHAVGMGCLCEPGVNAAKEAVDIPVIGELEAALHMASMLGRRWSIVGCGQSNGTRIRDLVRMYGLEQQLCSIRQVGGSPVMIAEQPQQFAELMLKTAEDAVNSDGAEVIIGYGGPDIMFYLQENMQVPIISPIQASITLSEALARSGHKQSRKTFPRYQGCCS